MIHSFQTIEKIPKPQQPKFWKRWVVSMLAVYPALILLVVVTRPFTEGMPAAASLFIVALLLTGLVGILGMGWLRRKKEDTT